jgi:hypothetical protein
MTNCLKDLHDLKGILFPTIVIGRGFKAHTKRLPIVYPTKLDALEVPCLDD